MPIFLTSSSSSPLIELKAVEWFIKISVERGLDGEHETAWKDIDGLQCSEEWIPRTSGGSNICVRIYKPLDLEFYKGCYHSFDIIKSNAEVSKR